LASWRLLLRVSIGVVLALLAVLVGVLTSLAAEQLSHRRVTAVLTFLRDAGQRG
jgi:hypothetical protein